MAEKLFVTRREVAEALGISRQRLHVLIGEGRIAETPRGIDIEAAKVAYRGTIDPARRAAWEEAAETARPAAPPSGRRVAVDEATGKTVDFSEARTRKEIANADRARLEYQIKAGHFIAREVVMAKEFAIARRLRDRILGFPARFADLLPPEAMASLTDECEALIRELQEEAAAVAEEFPA